MDSLARPPMTGISNMAMGVDPNPAVQIEAQPSPAAFYLGEHPRILFGVYDV